MTNAGILSEMLSERSVLLADGAMGTTLFELGLEGGKCPELLNVEQPELIKEVHRRYVEAGSDIVLTNSFGGTSQRLAFHRLEGRVKELNTRAVEILREVVDESGRQVAVAGDVGPTGELFEPVGPLTISQGTEMFAEQMTALADAGADVLWVETFSSLEELEAATEAASRIALPLVTTLSFDSKGRTMMGVTPEQLAEWWKKRDHKPFAIGANCGIGPADAVGAVFDIASIAPGVVMVTKPNAGMPVFEAGELRYPLGPEDVGDYVELALRAGARILGMCCGSTPAHIAAIRRIVDAGLPSSPLERSEIEERLGAHRAAGSLGEPPRRTRRREL